MIRTLKSGHQTNGAPRLHSRDLGTEDDESMNDQAKQYQQTIAKCWADEAFKQQLKADPVRTLKQEGFQLPEGFSINVLEDSEQQWHLVIPSKPDKLSDEQLEGSAGGLAWSGGHCGR